MSITVSPTQSNVFQALGNFIAAVTGLPATSIVQGQANRVAPPNVTDYVVMTPILMRTSPKRIHSVIKSGLPSIGNLYSGPKPTKKAK